MVSTVGFENPDFPRTPPQAMVTVYDLEGHPRSMTKLNAWDALTHLKWFSAIPGVAVSKAPRVVVRVSKNAPPPPSAKPEEIDEVDLTTMETPALRAFAKKHFNMDFKAEVSREDVLSAILSEQE